jgi:hypothetical protein
MRLARYVKAPFGNVGRKFVRSIRKNQKYWPKTPMEHMGKILEYKSWIRFKDGRFIDGRLNKNKVIERFPVGDHSKPAAAGGQSRLPGSKLWPLLINCDDSLQVSAANPSVVGRINVVPPEPLSRAAA